MQEWEKWEKCFQRPADSLSEIQKCEQPPKSRCSLVMWVWIWIEHAHTCLLGFLSSYLIPYAVTNDIYSCSVLKTAPLNSFIIIMDADLSVFNSILILGGHKQHSDRMMMVEVDSCLLTCQLQQSDDLSLFCSCHVIKKSVWLVAVVQRDIFPRMWWSIDYDLRHLQMR